MDLPLIVAAGAGIWERLADPSLTTRATAQSTERLARWQAALSGAQIADPPARLAKRLAWDGLTPTVLGPALGDAQWDAAQAAPDWANLLGQASRIARDLADAGPGEPTRHRAINSTYPLQFEELLLPFVHVAADRLQACIDPATYATLCPAAHADLERGLLMQLCRHALPTLQFCFSIYRALHPPIPGDPPHTRYAAFVQELLSDGLRDILEDYTALARLLAQTACFWIEATAELLERLSTDWPRIQATFDMPHTIPAIQSVQVALSDPHRNGRTVAILVLEGGARIVYKPRSLGLEQAFSRLLGWINNNSDLLDMQPTTTLDCGTHGWMAYVEQRACRSEAEVQRYYERAGQLLCLVYVLYGADMHTENIIASGEHPVFIDLEMLFQANLHHPLETPGLVLNSSASSLQQRVTNSVLRTALLPAWSLSPNGRALDVSGLGAVTETAAAYQQLRWQHVNSDAMAMEQHYPTITPGHNAPRIDGRIAEPNDYLAELTLGFERMYRWLMERHAVLPLHWFAGRPARFLLRATQFYFMVLGKALNPQYLHSGPDRSIQLDVLTRMLLRHDERPPAWPLVRAEIDALFQGDIPYFAYIVDSVDLSIGGEIVRENFFERSGYQLVVQRLAELNEDDLHFQLALIQGSMHTRAAVVHEPAAPINPQHAPLLSDNELIDHALLLADELERHALRFGDASGWLGYHLLQSAGRYQMQPLDFDLYNGVTGIALFLAALEATAGSDGRYRALALAGLSDLQHTIAAARPAQFTYTRIGGGDGLGSSIYGLLRTGTFLGEPALTEAARRLARLITPAMIHNDKAYDILSGTAGMVVCLTALFEATGDQYALDLAMIGGRHLLNTRVESDQGLRAWSTMAGSVPPGKLPAGMAHGAAGIAYALLSLAKITGETLFVDAASEAIAHEAALFVPAHSNWRDDRIADSEQTGGCMLGWCSGAPGIALARLGGLDTLDTPVVRADIEAAIATTFHAGAAAVDHCCCGTSGRIEALLTAGRKLQRPALLEQARRLANWMVERRQATGAHQLLVGLPPGTYHPGFFQGTAGIGYQLLRLVYPEQLPSVLLWE